MKHLSLLLAFFAISFASYAQAGLGEYTKAEHFRNLKKYQEAVAFYNKALQKEPNNVQYLERKCQCYNEAQLFNSSKPKVKKSLLGKAIECYQLVMEKDTSSNTSNHRILANLYSEQKEFDKAVETLDNAYERAEDIGDKFAFKLEIISLLFGLERVKDAGPHLEVAKSIFGDTPIPDVSYLNGLYNNVMGQYEEALNDMKVVIESNGELDKYMYQKGYAHFFLGQYPEAKKAFSSVKEPVLLRKIEKLQADNFIKIAEAYASIFEYAKADQMLEVVFGMDPGNQKATELREKYKMAGKNTVQIAKIQKKLETARKTGNGDTIKLYGSLSKLYYLQGDYEESRRAANEFLHVNNTNPTVSIIRGLSHYKLGTEEDLVEAEYTLQSVSDSKKFGSQSIRAAFALGVIQKETQQYKLAVKTFEKAARGSYKPAAEHEGHEIMVKMRQLGIDE